MDEEQPEHESAARIQTRLKSGGKPPKKKKKKDKGKKKEQEKQEEQRRLPNQEAEGQKDVAVDVYARD